MNKDCKYCDSLKINIINNWNRKVDKKPLQIYVSYCKDYIPQICLVNNETETKV